MFSNLLDEIYGTQEVLGLDFGWVGVRIWLDFVWCSFMKVMFVIASLVMAMLTLLLYLFFSVVVVVVVVVVVQILYYKCYVITFSRSTVFDYFRTYKNLFLRIKMLHHSINQRACRYMHTTKLANDKSILKKKK